MSNLSTLGPRLALLLCLQACGEPAQPATPAPFKLKLVDQPQALIQAPAELNALATLLDEDFADGLGSWRLATEMATPLQVLPEILQVDFPSEAGNSFLRLSGRRGMLYRLLPVQPGSAYVFSARTRATALEVAPGFQNAKPFLAELTRAGDADALMQSFPEEPLLWARQLFETCAGRSGWQAHERIFVTGETTETLLVVANYSTQDDILAGSVDFDDFRLQQVPLAVAWNQSLVSALKDFQRGETPHGDWRDRQLVRGFLGAEVRPSIVSYPGSSCGFVVRVPSQAPLLEGGVGPWAAALMPGAQRQLSYQVRIDGEPVWDYAHEVDARSIEDGWHELAVDLTPWAGRQVELELCSSGQIPGIFGAPTLRSSAPPVALKNLILISLDTLRADYVGCYGAAGNPTPNLDAFAAAGMLFARVDGQSTYTLPGHATMFSGQYPSVHGAQRPSQVLSGSRSPILARILSAAGYRTEAFTGGGLMNADFGFDKGFDRFANIDPWRHKDSNFFQAMLRGDPVAKRRLMRNREGPVSVTQEMLDRYGPEQLERWLDKHRDEPFFLFVHTYSVHDYDPPLEFLGCRQQGCTVQRTDYDEFRLTRKRGWNPQPISDAERDHMRHLYEGTVRQADQLVGRLLRHIQALGLDQNTVIAIATDHGEEMLERGFQQHGKTLYEELTRLPLMLQVPGLAARVIEEPVMMIDLAPTLLAALGLPRPALMDGNNLLEPLPAERITFSEIHDDFVHKYALRTPDGMKIIFAPKDDSVEFPAAREWELFDTVNDPGERRELSASEPETLARMQAEMHRHCARLRQIADQLDAVGSSAMSAAAQEQLGLLGYGDSADR